MDHFEAHYSVTYWEKSIWYVQPLQRHAVKQRVQQTAVPHSPSLGHKHQRDEPDPRLHVSRRSQGTEKSSVCWIGTSYPDPIIL